MWKSLQAGLTKLLKYWNKTDRSPAYIAAIVLDPTIKWQHFDTWDPQWRSDMRSTMKQFWETQYRSSTGLSSYSLTTQSPPITKTQNKYLEWKQRQKRLQSTASSQSATNDDEYSRYCNSEPLVLEEEGVTALDYWLKPIQRSRLPLLSKMPLIFNLYLLCLRSLNECFLVPSTRFLTSVIVLRVRLSSCWSV